MDCGQSDWFGNGSQSIGGKGFGQQILAGRAGRGIFGFVGGGEPAVGRVRALELWPFKLLESR